MNHVEDWYLDAATKVSTSVAGGPVVVNGERNSNVVDFILQSKENQYCTYKSIRLFVGTFNVNGQLPNATLSYWLSDVSSAPDIYAIGFQELDLSQQAFIFENSPREEEWFTVVKKNLHLGKNYVELKRVRLVGMFLVVFVASDIADQIVINETDSAFVGTGLLNRMGNKGGVAVRFRLNDSTFCFINSHFAAGHDEFDRRNQDFREVSKLRFFRYFPNALSVGIFDHDYIFWFGDLNYRLRTDPLGAMGISDIKKACQLMRLNELKMLDQLTIAKKNGLIFQEFCEGELNFLPTYKYDTGTDYWDTSEKCRVPAWCDRILYIGDNIRQLEYRSIPSIRLSDHKPVRSLFAVKVKTIDKQKYQKVYEAALRESDRIENEWLPQVSLDKLEFNFEDVRFLESRCQNLTIQNIGKVPVQFEFLVKPNQTSYCKRWLLITPESHKIKIGDKCVLDIQVLLEKESVWELNSKKDTLDDIVVLHLNGGKDFFLSIHANYVPSCFGLSLASLAALKGPIRGVKTEKLIDLADEQPQAPPARPPPSVPVPKELWRLVDHITRYGLEQGDLFGQAGSHSEFLAIREALDTGYPETLPGSVHSVVEALLRLLDSLPEPVVPLQFLDQCLLGSNSAAELRKVIDQFPKIHRDVFLFIVEFLKEVLKRSKSNGTNPNFLAAIFAPVILRFQDSIRETFFQRAQHQHKMQQAIQFVLKCLTNENI